VKKITQAVKCYVSFFKTGIVHINVTFLECHYTPLTGMSIKQAVIIGFAPNFIDTCSAIDKCIDKFLLINSKCEICLKKVLFEQKICIFFPLVGSSIVKAVPM
jgi:hypothetical protein